ncbi:MAG: hypothetical protein R3A46_03725 [Thermomicrobiales bacterium]
MTNVAITRQTGDTVEVSVILLVVRTSPDGRTISETPGRYAGMLVKEVGGWKIDRWEARLDANREKNLR